MQYFVTGLHTYYNTVTYAHNFKILFWTYCSQLYYADVLIVLFFQPVLVFRLYMLVNFTAHCETCSAADRLTLRLAVQQSGLIYDLQCSRSPHCYTCNASDRFTVRIAVIGSMYDQEHSKSTRGVIRSAFKNVASISVLKLDLSVLFKFI